MKKRILFILVCVLTAVSAYSQPTAAYYAENESGTYSELTGGTSALPTEFPVNGDFNPIIWGPDGQITAGSGYVDGFPIGFNFKYNNKNMTQFIVGPGYIVLGDENGVSSNDSSSSNRFNIVTDNSYENFIGVFIINGWGAYEDTEITYGTSGEEGSRVLVVQFKNIGACASRWNNGEGDFEKVQLQLSLHEDTGNIEFVFNDWQPQSHSDSDMSNVSIKIGFKGDAGEFVMLKSLTGTDISINSSEQMTWSTSSYPTDGQTITFVAPEDCEAPSAPTDLVLTSYSNYIEGSFTPAEDADHYLVLISESSSLSASPEDNVFYSAGDVIGDATVVAYTTNASFTTSSNLSGSTTYYLYVFANNSYCMFGPKYQSSALSGSASTLLTMPEALSVAEADITYVNLDATANSNNDKVLIAATTESAYDSYGQMMSSGVFGTPSGNLAVGDELDGGGQVVYIGEAKDGITVEGLEENMLYHFQAWSTDGNGAYSSTYCATSTCTGSNVPFVSNFGMMPLYGPIVGWEAEGDFDTEKYTSISSDTLLYCRASANASEGTVNHISTPVIQLAESANRVIIEFIMQQYYPRSWSIYSDWADDDVLRVEATTDGENYTTIYEITKDNVPEMSSSSFGKVYMPFYDLAGEKVHIRLYWKTYNSNDTRIYVGSIKVEEKADCDYPINLTAEPNGNQAVLDWDLQGNEGEWEVRYKLSDSDEWGDEITIDTKPYTLTDLPPLSDIDVQLRAKCDANTYSEWSETYTFRSGYGVPYTEEFSDGSLPSDWSIMTGELASPTEFTGTSSIWRYVSSGMMGKYLAFDPTTTSANDFNEWLIFPTVDMGDGSVNYIMSINYTRQATSVGTDDTYQFLVSANDEFNESDVIETFSHDEVNADGFAEFTTRLDGYSGMITPAFYIKSSTGRPIAFRVNSISILESCPSDISDIVLSDTTDTSVKVEWSTEAETSYVFIRKAGETDKPYVATTEKSIVFDGLDDRTDYEIGITKMCEEGDTAKVTIVKFTTLTYEGCPQVTDVEITPSKYEATITWEGEAEAYNVRYRKDGDDDWSVVSDIRENSVTLTDLDCATDYLCAIQSKCSTLESDTSAYTNDYTFTTLEETCFPPEDISVEPSIYSAVVTWTGESDSYAIGYALKDSNEWTEEQINVTEYTIEDLTPETDYKVRVRTYCSEEDYSQWSDAVEFTTLEIPECVTPSDLAVDEITNSSAKLSWKADEENLSWIIHYRKGDASSWTIVGDIEETQYELSGLDENSAYIWSVMAECEWSESDWASQNTFTTATATGISNADISEIKIFVSNNILNVSNPANGYIHSVVLYGVNGEILKEYVVNTSENVFIPLNNYSGQVVIVKVNGEKTEKVVKVSL